MNGWLLLFLVPLGTATRVSLFDDNDDDRNADSDGGEGGGEDGGDQVPVADNLDGALAGTEGDDTITATRDEVGATAEPNETEGFLWDYSGNDEIWDWDTRSDYPGDEPLPGLAVVDAGAGNDDITSGLSTHVDAGTGDDTISVDTTGAAEGTFRDLAATVEAGDGDDVVTATDPTETGRASTLDGGAGDDTLIGGTYEQVTTSGSHGENRWGRGDSDYLLLGGDGNDTIWFDRADTVTGGAGRDSLVYSGDANSSASVTDFTAGADVMTISLNPKMSA
ncbi:hypothetical protein ACFOMH_02620 [Paracoccus mangrovi]|uniref:Calcium-binding protein n=1 Tax=Paracoccus mangrovi TaxID=1715645 RepID=A0ABV7QYH1_9RHOB